MNATEIQIIRACPANVPAIRELTRSAYAKRAPAIGRRPIPTLADYHLAVREHLIDMLLVGDDYVALVEAIEKVDHLLIENVAVAPAFQGRGYGRMLVAHAETLAASLGYKEIRLHINKAFTRDISLYLGLGYGIDREEARKGGTVVRMSKLLDDVDLRLAG
jgi:GNAT superfamily N-acetyltransferase